MFSEVKGCLHCGGPGALKHDTLYDYNTVTVFYA